jgi:peptidoglycan/xylan/chitin deacetylase (PgdA/CDA1 family)
MAILVKIKSNIIAGLSSLNLDGLARYLKGERNALIILYHSPDAIVFEQHIAYLSKHYNFIPLSLLIEAIQQKNWSKIPKNSVVVTFDDGHASNYALSDTFKKYNIQPTIYICTQIVGTLRRYWWQCIPQNAGDKSDNYKRMNNQERLSILAKKYDFSQTENYPESTSALSIAQIKEMEAYVDFQAHTRFHPIMTMLNDADLQEECLLMQDDAQIFGFSAFKDFAFPNGDFSEKIINELQKAGFRSARTTQSGWANIDSNIYRLKTIGISDDASLSKMKLQLTSLLGLVSNWRERIKKINLVVLNKKYYG